MLQGSKDERQHPKVWPDLPLLLHRPREAAQQGAHLPLPRQQVLHGLQVFRRSFTITLPFLLPHMIHKTSHSLLVIPGL